MGLAKAGIQSELQAFLLSITFVGVVSEVLLIARLRQALNR